MNYANGKIYCLRSRNNNQLMYIGSTTGRLSSRLAKHKHKYNEWKNKKYHYVTSFKLFDEGNVYIELIEDCSCENIEQLRRREGQIIRSMECVNKLVAGRTKKEYYNENKTIILERSKDYRHRYYIENKEHMLQVRREYARNNRDIANRAARTYREKNREKINKKRREKITCECGKIISISAFSRHKQSKKHQTYIQSQSN